MKIKVGKETLKIYLEGSITSTNAPELDEEIMNAVNEHPDLTVVFDAEELHYIASAGLRILLKVRSLSDKNLEILNVSDNVLNTFIMTKFTDMFDISKPLRSVYLRHSVLTFRGINGDIYRLDDDVMIKVFKKGLPLGEAKTERDYAHAALVCGIPTLIPYDVVMVGGCYGVVYESAGCTTLGAALNQNPDKLETYAKKFAAFMRDLHQITIKDEFPSVKEKYRQWLEKAGHALSAEDRQSMDKIINSIPNSNCYIHGYITPGNVIVNGDEFLLMDMAGSAYGHPIVDLQGLYSALVEIEKDRPMYCSSTFGVSADLCRKFWDIFYPVYLSGKSDSDLAKMMHFLEDYYSLKQKLLSVVEQS